VYLAVAPAAPAETVLGELILLLTILLLTLQFMHPAAELAALVVAVGIAAAPEMQDSLAPPEIQVITELVVTVEMPALAQLVLIIL
jgi:hypothetical protein